jgi:4-amino-4-deoxy-L-arabinose transferase-like glycosyltransferase
MPRTMTQSEVVSISSSAHPAPRVNTELRLVWLVASLAIVLALLDAWTDRHWIDPDGVSYLDMSDALWRGDWDMAINAYWSPLYPALIGLFLRLLGPSTYWEYAVVHLVNFANYVFAALCFAFLLRELIRHAEAQEVGADGARVGLSTAGWILLGSTLFIWSSLVLITLWQTTPDMMVAAFVYVAAGLLVRIHRGLASFRTFTLFGLVLGVAYLAKAPMFPIAVAFLGTSVFIAGRPRQALPRVLVAVVAFAVVAGPWLIAISNAKGRPTFGESGALNYAWSAGEMPDTHWQGEDRTVGTPTHPTRRIPAAIPIYEFGSPIGGTYPVWYDPSYWEEGLRHSVDRLTRRNALIGRLFAVGISLRTYYQTFFDIHGSLVIGLLILSYMAGRPWQSAKDFFKYRFLAAPAVAALAMYGLVYAGPRMIAPFVVLIYLAAFASRRLSDSAESRRLLRAVPLAALLMLIVYLTGSTARNGARAALEVLTWRETPNENWQVADGLRQMGLTQGESVAAMKVVTLTGLTQSKWARLAKVRIIAEADATTAQSPVLHDDVVKAIASTGAKVIVADQVPRWWQDEGWRRIGTSKYYAYFLRR